MASGNFGKLILASFVSDLSIRNRAQRTEVHLRLLEQSAFTGIT